MGQCYGQLSLEERIEIYRLRAPGESMRIIARNLKRDVSTMCAAGGMAIIIERA